MVSQAVLQEGRPLIVRKVTESWKKELFSWYWLRDNSGDTYISPRNLQTLVDLQGWTMREYINYFLQEEKDRLVELYGKDASCPPEWSKYISDKLKPYSCHESSDLLADLPKELQPETLMLYIGMENTFTPGHIDTCASVGQNLMAHGDPDAYALWILFATQDRDKARELWSAYGGDIEEDNCYLPMEELKNSKAKFYVFRQRPGDLVFVPPDSVHQVVNKGGRSLKVAWNRIFPSTVEQSYESLLSYHKYQKPPVFRVKALAFCGAKNRIKGLKEKEQVEEGDRVAVRNELVPLLKLLKVIVNEEFVSEKAIKEMGEWEVMNYEDTLAHSRRCNICHADIFNRCYKCPVCEDFDVCFHCICEGRGCKLKNTHRKKYIMAENIPMKELMRVVEEGEELVRKVIGEEVEGVKVKEDSVATLAFRKVTKQKQNEKKLQAKKSKAKKKGSSSDTDEDKKVKKKKRTSSDVPKANKKKKSSKRSKTENIEQQLKKRKLSKDSKTKSKRRKASSDSDYEDKEPKNSQKRKYDSSMEEEEEYEEKRENKKKKRSSSNLKNTKKAVAKRSRDEAEKIETSKKAADVEDSEAGSLRRRKSKKHKDDMFYYEAMPETSESEEEEYSEEDSEFKLVTQKKPKKEKKVVSAAKPKKKVEDKQTTPKTTPKKSSSNSSSQKSMRFFSYIPIDVPPATSSVVPPEGPPNTGAPPSYPAVHFPQNQPPPPHILQRSDPYLTNPLLDPESPLTIQPLIQPAPFLPSSFQSPWAQPPPVPLSENNY
uniref:JmjC domain-containing protein n=1 Tax=Arcella intermedia TaxID=1963864 RepID=A0A6B2KY82_9EUKA